MTRDTPAHRLLVGLPGRDGFLFHDGFNQPVLQAAPGLLGLLEGRQAVERWKPPIVRWMDEAGHFFNHILHELGDEPSFAAIGQEIETIRALDGPASAKSRFLFQQLTAVSRELERSVALGRHGARTRRRKADARLQSANGDYSLNGVWTAYLRRPDGSYLEMPMELPVNWELVPGIENYAGTMRFTRTFDVPGQLADRRVLLAFSGVDYFSDLWVNGYLAGGHEGYFGPFEFDVTPYLRVDDTNVVRLAVTSPNDPAGDGTHVTSGWHDFRPASSFPNRKTLVKGTLGHHDAKRGGAWSSLTSQDGNTGGVWNDVHLRLRHPVHFDTAGTRVATLALTGAAGEGRDDRTATVRVELSVRNTTHRDVHAWVRIVIEPANFDGPSHELSTDALLSPGTSPVVVEERLSPVRPWQPWDHGFPHLYRVRAVLEADGAACDQTVVETGFRRLAVTAIGESAGADGAFVINGERAFVRGTNLLPTYWLSEYDEEAVARDLGLLRDAGFNAVMIHAQVGPKRFYEAANRAGLLVVQMFPLQWSYEQSSEFVARARRQMREMAALLYNEPSVVSYEVHNEPDMRTAEDLDNRLFDFDLHSALREADPHRWATTFSSGNHAYPGQFYPLRDDNSFATLPARFLEEEFHGRRISRHRNMPTEFGIQAMPNLDLFAELVSERRVRKVMARLRNDPKWIAAGGETWTKARRSIDAAKAILGQGSWTAALEALDWQHLSKLMSLGDEIAHLKHTGAGETDERVLARRLALILVEVLHFGAFKGECFWFGNWRPAHSLAEFVRASQDRQYRLHKDAIENYLNAGVTGPIVGYFSFMFRDADWQAPTWGVVDAAWVPKKAYRAYVESNHPARVTLPQALRAPVKLPGDAWFGIPEGRGGSGKDPWVDAEMIVANDTPRRLPGAQVAVWLESAAGTAIPFVDRSGRSRNDYRVTVDVEPSSGFSFFDRVSGARAADPPGHWIVDPAAAAGTYWLRASIADADGTLLSTNSYEMLVPDTAFGELSDLSAGQIRRILHGAGRERFGFHFWERGHVVHRAAPGVIGLLEGCRHAERSGIDVYEAVQGDHFFRHILGELEGVDGADFLVETIWTIRSETISPSEKSSALLRYLDVFSRRASEAMATAPRIPKRRPALSPPPVPAVTGSEVGGVTQVTAVGRDRASPATGDSQRRTSP